MGMTFDQLIQKLSYAEFSPSDYELKETYLYKKHKFAIQWAKQVTFHKIKGLGFASVEDFPKNDKYALSRKKKTDILRF